MSHADTLLAKRLLERIEETLRMQTAGVLSGDMEPGTYKYSTGYIRALRDVAVWCEEEASAIAKD